MERPIITVEGLGKEYIIGGRDTDRSTFREMLVSAVAAPFRRLRRLRGSVTPEERIWALKDVSFEVRQGEVVGIIGRNGAGKSTLLKILSRITDPTEGRVRIRGRVSSLLEVGTGFHPELTGRQNIYLNGAILGMSRGEINRKFDEIVDFSGVEKFLDTPVKRYSSGMTVRLAFAVAAHLEPEILIVDEVLAVGDAEFQKKCLGKIKDVSGAGRTVLFVSHNLGAVQNLCVRCIGLQHGRIFIDANPDAVIASYLRQTRYSVRTLPQIEIRKGDGKTRFKDIVLLNENDEIVTTATSGKPIKIQLVTTGIISAKACRVSLAFSTYQGTRLFVCSTEFTPGLSLTSDINDIICHIPRMPLGAGTYLLTLFIEQNGTVSDWIDDGIELNVNGLDFYGTGRDAPRGWEGKTVLVDHFWSSGIQRKNNINNNHSPENLKVTAQ